MGSPHHASPVIDWRPIACPTTGSPPGVNLEASPHWSLQMVTQKGSTGLEEKMLKGEGVGGGGPRRTAPGKTSCGAREPQFPCLGHDKQELNSGGSRQDTTGPVSGRRARLFLHLPQLPAVPTMPLTHLFHHLFLQLLDTAHRSSETGQPRGPLGDRVHAPCWGGPTGSLLEVGDWAVPWCFSFRISTYIYKCIFGVVLRIELRGK